VTILVRRPVPPAPRALAPIQTTLAGMRARLGEAATHGIHPSMMVGPAPGWIPATLLVDGSRVPQLIDAAKQRWGAQPHAAAALAWKSYTYWVSLPAVAGFVAARRVPLLYPEDVLVELHDRQPFLTIGLTRATVAVLPGDPLAARPAPGIEVVRDEPALLARLRGTLLDAHLDPILDQLHRRVHLGRRTLLGSVASGIAYGIVRSGVHASPESTVETIRTVLTALAVDDLVDLSVDEDATVRIQRRTCCLAFTLPEPKICTGCVLG
jgi:hypothetical protein